MASSNTATNTPPGDATGITYLMEHPHPSVGTISLHPTPRKTLSSSSINSSPDSPLDADPFNSDDDDDNNSISSTQSSPSSHKRDQIPLFNKNSVNSVTPVNYNNTNSSSTEAPSNQAMERTYRIPSSVFARSKSNTAPMEWSVASNESLFSIHTGNMSFRNDHAYWRSGELNAGPGEASTSDHMFSYSAQQPKRAEIMRSQELGLAEATMKEVIRESECQKIQINHAKPSLAAEDSRHSHGSAKSFAFSIKAGDSQKSTMSRTPSSVRSGSDEHEQCQPEPLTKAEPQPSTYCDQKSPSLTPNSARPKWSPSCFSCCSLW